METEYKALYVQMGLDILDICDSMSQAFEVMDTASDKNMMLLSIVALQRLVNFQLMDLEASSP